MRVKRGSTFRIDLDVIPSAGYQWRPSFSAEYLEAAGEDVALPGQAVGGSAKVRYRFRALREGTTEIRLTLQRAWEDAPIEERVVKVIITR